MNITSAKASLALTCTGTPRATNVLGSSRIGGSHSVEFSGAEVAYALRAILATTADYVTVDLTLADVTASGTSWVAGVAQVATATAVGTITAAGTASVTVTAAGMTGSPKTLAVSVADTDTPTLWAAKVRAALTADGSVTASHTVSGAGADIIVSRNPTASYTVPTGTLNLYAADDATLNIALDNGTCTGITADASSTATTAGVISSGVKTYNETADFEGATIPATTVKAVMIANAGGALAVTGATAVFPVAADGYAFFTSGGTLGLTGDTTLTLTTGAGPSDIVITVIGDIA